MTEIDLKDRASYTHWTPVHIRFADMDILRHVNNVAQAEYFEAARTAFVYDIINLAGVDQTNEFVLARVVIDFHRELHYPGSVEVGARESLQVASDLERQTLREPVPPLARERVERERALAAAGHAADRRERAARDRHVEAVEVVHADAAQPDFFLDSRGRHHSRGPALTFHQ